MDSLGDLIKSKIKQLDFDSKKSEQDIIKAELARLHGKSVVLIKINKDRSILVEAESAAKATEVRFHQAELLQVLNSAVKEPLKAIRIVIK